jgi:hypothetical protein
VKCPHIGGFHAFGGHCYLSPTAGTLIYHFFLASTALWDASNVDQARDGELSLHWKKYDLYHFLTPCLSYS